MTDLTIVEALQAVVGATSEKDTIPVLKHFAFRNGVVYATDGRMTLSAPCPELAAIEGTVDAERMLAAIIGLSEDEVSWKHEITASHIIVKSKHFTARLPFGTLDSFPFPEEQLTIMKYRKLKLLPLLKLLHPFVSTDASRPWSCGVYFGGMFAAATNNAVLALCPIPINITHDFMLPLFAIDELLRLDQEPLGYHLGENRVTFKLPQGILLHSSLFNEQWPKPPVVLLKQLATDAKYKAISANVPAALERLLPFCLDPKAPVICFDEATMSTVAGEVQGIMQGLKGLGQCRFRAEPLREVLKVATHADFTKFPRVPWRGEEIEGIIVGVMA